MLILGIGLYWMDVMLQVEGFTGYWVIFTPFVPGFVWALYMKIKSTTGDIGTSDKSNVVTSDLHDKEKTN